jgi:hypothetical protein
MRAALVDADVLEPHAVDNAVAYDLVVAEVPVNRYVIADAEHVVHSVVPEHVEVHLVVWHPQLSGQLVEHHPVVCVLRQAALALYL